jgi:hypothetical protein
MATCELHPAELGFDDAYTEFMHQTEDDVAVVAFDDDEPHPEPDDVYGEFVGRIEA